MAYQKSLVDALGMGHEIKPLINSERDFDEFGKVVLDILENYRESPPRLKIFKGVYGDFDRKETLYYIRKPERETYAKMIDDFKMHYGINVKKPMKRTEIARHNKVSRQVINNRLNYVLAVLSKHKRDIWYDML